MDQLERPSELLWDERRAWFEEQEAQRAKAGAPAPSEQACALIIDLQAVFCSGAWAAAVILAYAIAEAQSSHRAARPEGVGEGDWKWLRALRNRLVHENPGKASFTVEDQWMRRDLWEERARHAVVIAFAALYPDLSGRENAAGERP
ncbi:hypothetical protein HBA54_26425 [Pelagibius litoralis]|uniref:Uncharacterized protein n=1 Tax=Pelagibius litoralis TaxID=374515 RepID=A0A967F3C0_9PROT|nr:hypothetical protein [Pelagibius litoralis]NIA72130.1 hypothetical protein [Pelagibius litoralis]